MTPSIWKLQALKKHIETGEIASRDGKTWYPARPLNYRSFGTRLRAAWMVLCGRADALVWDGGQ